MKQHGKTIRGKCKSCGKVVALKAPTGNWLDAIYPRAHKLPDGKRCEGQWKSVEPLSAD